MEAEVTKEPVINISSTISFWNKQDTNDAPKIPQITTKPIIPKPREARSPTPPPVASKPKMNTTLLRDARPPIPPPPVPLKPNVEKRDAASAGESIPDIPWQEESSHQLLAMGGMDKKPPDILNRTPRNLSSPCGAIWNSRDPEDMSKELPKTYESSCELLKTNQIPMNLPSKDGILKNPSRTDAVPMASLKTDGFLKDPPRTDGFIKDLPRTDGFLKDPLRTDAFLKDPPRTDGFLKDLPRTDGFLKDPQRTDAFLKDLSKTDEISKGSPITTMKTPDETTARNPVDAERFSVEFKLVNNPSIEDCSLSVGSVTSKGSVGTGGDVESFVTVGLGTLDLSIDEPNPDVDLSPNIRDYEEKLKDSFRKARLRKASPKLKRKDLSGRGVSKQPLPGRHVPNEPSALLEAKTLWESCLKDDTGVAPRQYGQKYLERDSARQLIASKKPEVSERFKRENFSERDTESIFTKVSYFDSKFDNTDQPNHGLNSTARLIESIEKRLEYRSPTFTPTYFQRSKDGANTEFDGSKQCSSGGIQFTSSGCKGVLSKSETPLKLAPNLENESFVQPEKRQSTFQSIPVRFSSADRSQPNRWNFMDALLVPAGEDASTSSSTDSNNLPSTSNSDQPSIPGELDEQGTSFGCGDEDPSSASGSASIDSSTEETDEEVTQAEAPEGATGREGAQSAMSPVKGGPLTSRRSRRKSQLAKSHRKSSQAPNGGHRQLKKSRSLENLYKLYHHLVVTAQNRPVQGDDVENVDALIQSAGDNILDEPEAIESEPELEEPQPAHVRRRPMARRSWIRRNLILDLFVVFCCVLGSYSVLIAYLAGIVPKNDFIYGDFDDDYWRL